MSNVAKSSRQAKIGYGSVSSANKQVVGDLVREVVVECYGYVVVSGIKVS